MAGANGQRLSRGQLLDRSFYAALSNNNEEASEMYSAAYMAQREAKILAESFGRRR